MAIYNFFDRVLIKASFNLNTPWNIDSSSVGAIYSLKEMAVNHENGFVGLNNEWNNYLQSLSKIRKISCENYDLVKSVQFLSINEIELMVAS
ncbi:hypothetical protein [Halobacteriovorax sp. CON-3]|uniref:hypothetical protein n=1 Tax=Halobacteriovorax sp. CON-3 TaxID=3157710 RepID=UPI00371DAF6A